MSRGSASACLIGSCWARSLTCFGITLVMMLLGCADRLINEIAASGGKVRFFVPLMVGESPYYLGLALLAAFFISMFIAVSGQIGELPAAVAAWTAPRLFTMAATSGSMAVRST